MAINLETAAEDFDATTPQAKAMLANLQSNILKPHGRNFVRHLFLRFSAAPAAARGWIKENVLPLVRSADHQFNAPAAEVDGGLVGGFFLTAAGYKKLGFKTNGFASEAFRSGMKNRDESFFDELIGIKNRDPDPNTWEDWSRGEIHALLTLADDDKAKVEEEAARLVASTAGVALVLTVQDGNVLRRKVPGKDLNDGEPVEHFGYRDGLSQPVFTKGDLEDVVAQPGANLERWNPSARLSLVLVDDPLIDAPDTFGSYLVYRKLAQNLLQFNQGVVALAEKLSVDADLAGAYIVGRFKDGTPVVKAKAEGLGETNGFDFRHDDPDGLRCPMHAHIRKVNPRGTTPLTSLSGEKLRRIARRGIPYGPPIGEEVADYPPSDPNPDLPRGLLFLCFQANIEEQFEFIQRTWIDNKIFPRGILLQGNTGDDPLIGQDANEPQDWPVAWGDSGAETREANVDAAVSLRGGEYFFAPSIPFLKSL